MNPSRFPQFLRRLEKRLLVVLVAICTKHMEWFASFHAFFQRIGENARTDFGELVALLICVPCFQTSHFFFKIAYLINQRRLRRLCGENLFLEFYDRPVARGGIVNTLQSLRYIKHGLEDAEACNQFSRHDVSSKRGTSSQTASYS